MMIGFEIFVLAIGNKASRGAMRQISRSDDHIFTADSATKLLNQDLISQMTSDICQRREYNLFGKFLIF